MSLILLVALLSCEISSESYQLFFSTSNDLLLVFESFSFFSLRIMFLSRGLTLPEEQNNEQFVLSKCWLNN